MLDRPNRGSHSVQCETKINVNPCKTLLMFMFMGDRLDGVGIIAWDVF